MEFLPYFKSVLEQDRAPIVICDLSHTILYMNPAAKNRYSKHGDLIGKSLLDCHNPQSNEQIKRVTAWFAESADNNIVYTFRNVKENRDVYMIALRAENGELIGYYEKHEYRNVETMQKYDYSKGKRTI